MWISHRETLLGERRQEHISESSPLSRRLNTIFVSKWRPDFPVIGKRILKLS